MWCVCGGCGVAVAEMPKGATSDRWVYIHMHAAGSVASWQFQPSPPALLFMCMPRSAQPPAPPPVLIPSATAAASAAATKACSNAAATAFPHRLRHDRHLLSRHPCASTVSHVSWPGELSGSDRASVSLVTSDDSRAAAFGSVRMTTRVRTHAELSPVALASPRTVQGVGGVGAR